MSAVVIICMVYSLNKLHTQYQRHAYATLEYHAEGRKVLSLYKLHQYQQDIKHNAVNLPDLTIQSAAHSNKWQRSSSIEKTIKKVQIENAGADEDPDDRDMEDGNAKMLDEIDGYNYFVVWEDEADNDKVKDKHDDHRIDQDHRHDVDQDGYDGHRIDQDRASQLDQDGHDDHKINQDHRHDIAQDGHDGHRIDQDRTSQIDQDGHDGHRISHEYKSEIHNDQDHRNEIEYGVKEQIYWDISKGSNNHEVPFGNQKVSDSLAQTTVTNYDQRMIGNLVQQDTSHRKQPTGMLYKKTNQTDMHVQTKYDNIKQDSEYESNNLNRVVEMKQVANNNYIDVKPNNIGKVAQKQTDRYVINDQIDHKKVSSVVRTSMPNQRYNKHTDKKVSFIKSTETGKYGNNNMYIENSPNPSKSKRRRTHRPNNKVYDKILQSSEINQDLGKTLLGSPLRSGERMKHTVEHGPLHSIKPKMTRLKHIGSHKAPKMTPLFVLSEEISPQRQTYDRNLDSHNRHQRVHVVNTNKINDTEIPETVQSYIKRIHIDRLQRGPHNHYMMYMEMRGRLGNNMFQFASLYSIARALNRTPVISDSYELFDTFNRSLRRVVLVGQPESHVKMVSETFGGMYSTSLYNLPNMDLQLCCYLQSWKYFVEYEHEIHSFFQFKDWIQIRAKGILSSASNLYRTKDVLDSSSHITYVGVHVRRTDVINPQHLQRGYKPASLSYIHKAMDYFRQKYANVYFIVCSDNMTWCEKYLSEPDVYFVEDQDSIVDMAVLTKCNHTIMTVGTFSWWAAWLTGGDVTYYSNWPSPHTEISDTYNHEDYFMPHWKPMGD